MYLCYYSYFLVLKYSCRVKLLVIKVVNLTLTGKKDFSAERVRFVTSLISRGLWPDDPSQQTDKFKFGSQDIKTDDSQKT